MHDDEEYRMGNHPLGHMILGTLAGLAGIGLAMILVAWARPVWAHEAPPTAEQPLGWQYDYSCCSLIDCRPVPDSAIHEGPNGYTIKATGELIPYGDKRIRDSKDGYFHWCSVAGKPDSKTICLYRAPRGF